MPRMTFEPPESSGWLRTTDAATRLRLGQTYLAAGARTGQFPVVQHGGTTWIREADVEAMQHQRAEDRQRWASRAEVALLAACARSTVNEAVAAGLIATRPGSRQRGGGLERVSAERWAAEYRSRHDKN